MKRILFAVIALAVSAIACSIGSAGSQTVEESSEIPQQAEGVSPERESSQEEPTAAQPTLSDVEMGNCDSDIGTGANLAKCTLIELNLSESNLSGAILAQADLSSSNLSKVDFSNANMVGTNANKSNMTEANFSNADLTNANLSQANLIDADFTGAITINVDFGGSNLAGANITQEQLDQALSVKQAVLPDGTIGK